MRAAIFASAFVVAAANAQSPLDQFFRSIDGRGNNFIQSEWGAAGIPLLRQALPRYPDGSSDRAEDNRPNARAISNALANQAGSQLCWKPVTDFVWQWGQFIDHDMDLTSGGTGESFDISVPTGDLWFDPAGNGDMVIPMERSNFVMRHGVRQQVNEITAYLDGSVVYGSDALRAAELRAAGGLLKTSPGDLLPFNVNGFDNAPTSMDPSFFLAGDVRANEQVGLTAMHTLFVREHNLLARALGSMGLSDELSYQLARMFVGAEIQAITYREFLPALLGENAMPEYRGYNERVDASIANEFSTGAYRFGHSMLSPVLQRLSADGSVSSEGSLPLKDAFFSPQEIVDHGIESILRGLASQRPQEIDCQVIGDVRNFLFGQPGAGGFDLAALNMQRGRDHGLPRYNDLRRAYELEPAHDFNDISSVPALNQALARMYDSVEDVDLWMGGLAEDHYGEAIVGELFYHVIRDQFERLRAGDRFYYRRLLPPEFVQFVESRTLSTIIRDNTEIGSELQDQAFWLKPGSN
ncbi:MAG: peroxidase family protein [Planctomycetota bacterium]|jgi:hypothetical protein